MLIYDCFKNFLWVSYVCSNSLLALGKYSGVRTCSRLNTQPAFEGVEKSAVFLGVDNGIPFLDVTYRGKLLRFVLCKKRLDFFLLGILLRGVAVNY